MAKLIASLEQSYSLHEDGWTETLAGLKTLIILIKSMEEKGDSFNAILLLRHVYISSSYLAEQTFNKTVKEFIELDSNQINDNERKKYSLKKVGISYAMKNWPKRLTDRKLNLGNGCLQALKEITNKRNDIVHKLNDHSNYKNPGSISETIVYSTIEACKAIEQHFFPEREFSYEDWLATYPIKQTEFYKKI